MKKRMLALVLVLLMLGSLTACKEEAPNPTGNPDSTPNISDSGNTDPSQSEETDPTQREETDPTQTEETDPTQSTETQPTQPANDGKVPESALVSGSFFDDAVFVGDSVSLKLSYYEAAVNKLGKAQFLASGSLGSGNALWKVSSDSVHPLYKGQKMQLEDSIPLTGAKKLYIMLGMNDIAVYGIQGSVDNMVKLIEGIVKNVPGMKVYIQSMTPLGVNSNVASKNGLNNENIRKYNALLLSTAKEKGWYFVDVGEVMYDSQGYLREDYCSDPNGMAIHFTNAGCEAWIKYLLTHTA